MCSCLNFKAKEELCKRSIVLEQGIIIEQGAFDDLYSQKNRFYELWEKQKL